MRHPGRQNIPEPAMLHADDVRTPLKSPSSAKDGLFFVPCVPLLQSISGGPGALVWVFFAASGPDTVCPAVPFREGVSCLQESGENYLETILILKERNGSVRSVDIAAELGYTKASVSRAMSILKENNYVTMAGNGEIEFTDAGRDLAESIYDRHRHLTQFLQMALGVSEDIAARDACRIEHVISPETSDAVKRYVHDNEKAQQ